MATIQRTIQVAKVSEYLTGNDVIKGKLKNDIDLPFKIWAVRKAVEWQYNNDISGIVSSVDAMGTITIDTLGNNGDIISVQVDDPLYGNINLAYYVKVAGDNTVNAIASALDTLINANPYGYTSEVVNNEITITARDNVGAEINGKLKVIYNNPLYFITINNADVLLINDTDQFVL